MEGNRTPKPKKWNGISKPMTEELFQKELIQLVDEFAGNDILIEWETECLTDGFRRKNFKITFNKQLYKQPE